MTHRLALLLVVVSVYIPTPSFAINADLLITQGHAVDFGGLIIGSDLAGAGFSFGRPLIAEFPFGFSPFLPGTAVTPFTSARGIADMVDVTILGIQYSGSPFGALRSFIGGGVGPFEFTSGFEVPFAGPGTMLTFTGPFVLNQPEPGNLVHIICAAGTGGHCPDLDHTETFDLRLIGRGTGSLTLLSNGPNWDVTDLHYDFTAGLPPDPTLTVIAAKIKCR
jgi:hypothetical protein